MTVTLATSSGLPAVEALAKALRPEVDQGLVTLVTHREHVVAWSPVQPWVSSWDDGELLVVVDGRLHAPRAADLPPAEQVAARYRRLGAGVAAGLLGDFVLVVLDRSRHLLVVARDPVGVRPWYVAARGRLRAGATDSASLCRLGWPDASVDEGFAIRYLAGEVAGPGETFHRGVRTLEPGHTWRSDGTAERLSRHHVWSLAFDRALTFDGAAERCREALDAAVADRVEVAGAATSDLSGGLDSSAVVGTAALRGVPDLMVGRLLFDGPAADERTYSDLVADHWGLSLVSAPPWIAGWEEVEQLTQTLRRPPPDPNSTMFASLYQAFQSLGRKEGMTGVGGDDAFVAAGPEARLISALQLRQPDAALGLVRRAARHPRRTWFADVRPVLRHLAPWLKTGAPHHVTAAAAQRAGLVERLNRQSPRLTGILAIDDRADALSSGYQAAILQEAALSGDLFSFRSTHPYFDPRVIDATYPVDPRFAARDGQVRALQVEAFADRLPEGVRRRTTKAEFSAVVWPSALQAERLERTRSGPLVERGWLEPAGFDELVAAAHRQVSGAALPLWRAMALDVWLR